MAKIKWTPQSLDDIEAIANFIARDSDYYAWMFTTKIFETVERLELFSESGRIVPELNRKEIRINQKVTPQGFKKIYKQKTVLLTGATGLVGSYLPR